MNSLSLKMLNGLLFHTLWWGCVAGTKLGYHYFGILITLIFLTIHFRFISDIKNEFRFIAICFLVGLAVELAHLHFNLLQYNGYIFDNNFIPPLWILCMWIGFSATVNHSMKWLNDRWILMIILGGVFGPLSYIAGYNLDVIIFLMDFNITVIVLGVIWAMSIPLMYKINKILN